MRYIPIIIILVFMIISLGVNSQETETEIDLDVPAFVNNPWTMTPSQRIIAIGQTLWINITGPSWQPYELSFTPLDNTTSDEFTMFGMTNENGTQLETLELEQTRNAGSYFIALVINKTYEHPGIVYEVAELEIRYDPNFYNQILIHDLEARINVQQEEINTLRIEQGQLIIKFREVWAIVIFVFCYMVVRTAFDIHIHGIDYYNRISAWNHYRKLSDEVKLKYPQNISELHYIQNGGVVYKTPGHEDVIPDDFPEEYQQLRGMDTDEALAFVIGESKKSNIPELPDIPKPKRFSFKFRKNKDKPEPEPEETPAEKEDEE